MYFIDVETVRAYKSFDLAPPEIQKAYLYRFRRDLFQNGDDRPVRDLSLHYTEHAGLTAEFGKIVCVCLGRIKGDEIEVKILCSRFEKLILQKLKDTIDRVNAKGEQIDIQLCAHNGFEFDYPYLFRRFQINGIPVPRVLDVNSLKKWEWPLFDTMTMWSHTAWNYRCSLDLMCQVLGIQSPKSDITGADVADIYYGMFDGVDENSPPFDKETEALNKIGWYCAGDVIATARLYRKLKGLSVPTKSSIVE